MSAQHHGIDFTDLFKSIDPALEAEARAEAERDRQSTDRVKMRRDTARARARAVAEIEHTFSTINLALTHMKDKHNAEPNHLMLGLIMSLAAFAAPNFRRSSHAAILSEVAKQIAMISKFGKNHDDLVEVIRASIRLLVDTGIPDEPTS